MKKALLSLGILVMLGLMKPVEVLGVIGVGVGTGKIVIDEELNPGTIYELPPLTVINTGDEPSDYEVGVTYHQDQEEMEPPNGWFSFSPDEFYLEPGEAQVVNIKVNLPLKAKPGKYFGYLEGRPVKKAESGQTKIGVAAAAKMYFTVAAANVFQGLYYRLLAIWKTYAPWPKIGVWLVVIGFGLRGFKRRFNLNIQLKKKTEKDD